MADYLLFQKAQRKSFMMNSVNDEDDRATLLCQNRCFQLQKRSQLLIGTHDEPLAVTIGGNNPDSSPFKIKG